MSIFLSGGEEFMPYQSYQNTLHLINTHIHMLDHTSVEHACGNMPPTAFLLQVIETLQDDAFTVGETVSDVWQILMRITVMHIGSMRQGPIP
jgi:hypothetical protein